MTVRINKPAINLREELTSLRNQVNDVETFTKVTTTDLTVTDVAAETISTTGNVTIGSGLLELDGNDIGGTQVTIADDAVASITPPRKGGFMFVTAQGTTDYPDVTSSAVIFYDVGASLTCLKQSFTGIGSGVLVSTSDVTGTTSTDNTITVAVQTGVIKIENRKGGARTFQITFL